MPDDIQIDSELEIAHVLFSDIVGYSKLPVDAQSELVRELNQIVRNSAQFRKAEAAGKLIRIPTGDGIALAFFTTPDAPVRCAMEIGEVLASRGRLQLRMGIHSGPVDAVSDVNDRSNLTGAGINMAQRVMDCGDAGHILLSKRLADDLAQYSKWQPHLQDLGEVEVKHGVRLGVVNFYGENFGNSKTPGKLERAQKEVEDVASRAKRRRRWQFASVALVAFILLGVGFWISRRAPRNREASAIPEKSIAVLPFDNFGNEKENAYFADGVQDDVLTDLAKVADLKVISRRSVAQYRGSTKDIREIGKALGVAYVLEGSVRKSGGKIHITAQMSDTRNQTQKWAEKYDRELADVFAIQSEISEAIVAQLKATLSPTEKAAIEKPATQDLEAYDMYLQARALVYVFGAGPKTVDENRPRAEKLLEQAIARDPKFVLAYCLLSGLQSTPNWAEALTPEQIAKAKATAETAVRIAPESGDAHLALGSFYYSVINDKARGVEELALAARTMPNSVDVVSSVGEVARDRGQWKEALQNFEKAVRLDPRDPDLATELINFYFDLRRYHDAELLADRTMASLSPDSTGQLWGLKRAIALARGDTKAAMAAIESSPDHDKSPQSIPLRIAMILSMERRYAEAAAIIESIPERARNNKDGPRSGLNAFANGHDLGELGVIYRAQGETEKARATFDAAKKSFSDWLGTRPEELEALGWVAVCDAGADRKADALREAQRAMEIWPMSREPLRAVGLRYHVATVYAWNGDREGAIQLLDEVVKLPGGPEAGDLKLNPRWDDLRKDPRFERIIAAAAEPAKID